MAPDFMDECEALRVRGKQLGDYENWGKCLFAIIFSAAKCTGQE